MSEEIAMPFISISIGDLRIPQIPAPAFSCLAKDELDISITSTVGMELLVIVVVVG